VAEFLLYTFDALAQAGSQVLVTATSAMDLHPLLRTMHVFGETIEVKSLDAVARQEVGVTNCCRRIGAF